MATLATQTLPKATVCKVLESVFPFDEYSSALSTLGLISRDSTDMMIGSLFDLVHILTYEVTNHDSTYSNRLIGRLCMENVGTFEALEKISSDSRTAILKKSPDQYTHLRMQRRTCYCQNDDEAEDSDSE
jgi:hypothetical protein